MTNTTPATKTLAQTVIGDTLEAKCGDMISGRGNPALRIQAGDRGTIIGTQTNRGRLVRIVRFAQGVGIVEPHHTYIFRAA